MLGNSRKMKLKCEIVAIASGTINLISKVQKLRREGSTQLYDHGIYLST